MVEVLCNCIGCAGARLATGWRVGKVQEAAEAQLSKLVEIEGSAGPTCVLLGHPTVFAAAQQFELQLSSQLCRCV